MTPYEMTTEERESWSDAELVARIEDLKDCTPMGIDRAKKNAEKRRKAIGLSRSMAASWVIDAERRKWLDATRTPKEQKK